MSWGVLVTCHRCHTLHQPDVEVGRAPDPPVRRRNRRGGRGQLRVYALEAKHAPLSEMENLRRWPCPRTCKARGRRFTDAAEARGRAPGPRTRSRGSRRRGTAARTDPGLVGSASPRAGREAARCQGDATAGADCRGALARLLVCACQFPRLRAPSPDARLTPVSRTTLPWPRLLPELAPPPAHRLPLCAFSNLAMDSGTCSPREAMFAVANRSLAALDASWEMQFWS